MIDEGIANGTSGSRGSASGPNRDGDNSAMDVDSDGRSRKRNRDADGNPVQPILSLSLRARIMGGKIKTAATEEITKMVINPAYTADMMKEDFKTEIAYVKDVLRWKAQVSLSSRFDSLCKLVVGVAGFDMRLPNDIADAAVAVGSASDLVIDEFFGSIKIKDFGGDRVTALGVLVTITALGVLKGPNLQ